MLSTLPNDTDDLVIPVTVPLNDALTALISPVKVPPTALILLTNCALPLTLNIYVAFGAVPTPRPSL